MAGSLIKIDEEIVTSAVASVSLLGIDSTYDVYMVSWLNLKNTNASYQDLSLRLTVSGTPDTSANYDRAAKNMASDSVFYNESNTNSTEFTIGNQINTTSQAQSNGILYLFNFNNASEYSFFTCEAVDWRYNLAVYGRQGGGVHTVAQACDGIQFLFISGYNFTGTFTLYGLKK